MKTFCRAWESSLVFSFPLARHSEELKERAIQRTVRERTIYLQLISFLLQARNGDVFINLGSYPSILSSTTTSYRNGRNKRSDTQEEIQAHLRWAEIYPSPLKLEKKQSP